MHRYCTNALHTYKKKKSILDVVVEVVDVVVEVVEVGKNIFRFFVVVVVVGKILLMTGRFAS